MATAEQVQLNPVAAATAYFTAARADRPVPAKSPQRVLEEAIDDYTAQYRDCYQWHKAALDQCNVEIAQIVVIGEEAAKLALRFADPEVAANAAETITDELVTGHHADGLYRQAAAVAAAAAKARIAKARGEAA